ncbi:MAG: PEP-CTERM sorting domain-containing protein [Gemmatimonadales bacterium]
MQLKSLGLALLLTVPVSPVVGQGTMASFNEFATLTNKEFGASSIGWYFTPTSSFFLTSIQTRFNGVIASADRTVTAELWSDRAWNGGSLLRSSQFQSSSALGSFGGGSFDGIWLEAGSTYFVGFRNVEGLGRNSTEDAGSQSSGHLYYSLGDPALGNYAQLQNVSMVYNPSFALQGFTQDPSVVGSMPTTATPEPASMILMATGMVGMGVVTMVRRRRALRSQQEGPTSA